MSIAGLLIGDWRADRRNCDLRLPDDERFADSGLISRGSTDAIQRGMNPKAVELQARTRRFATAVIKFCERLPNEAAAQKVVSQLLDSAGSTDSNYRATCRARSPDEFIAKIGVAAEEADESKGWLELLVSAGLAATDNTRELIREADELTAIFVASRKTAQRRKAERERLEQQLRTASRRRSK